MKQVGKRVVQSGFPTGHIIEVEVALSLRAGPHAELNYLVNAECENLALSCNLLLRENLLLVYGVRRASLEERHLV